MTWSIWVSKHINVVEVSLVVGVIFRHLRMLGCIPLDFFLSTFDHPHFFIERNSSDQRLWFRGRERERERERERVNRCLIPMPMLILAVDERTILALFSHILFNIADEGQVWWYSWTHSSFSYCRTPFFLQSRQKKNTLQFLEVDEAICSQCCLNW